MADIREAKVPDIGDFEDVPVIEVMVQPGDEVDKDQGLVTLESAKATMEVPSPFAGTVKDVKVKVDDKVSEGSVIAMIEAASGQAESSTDAQAEKPAKSDEQSGAAAGGGESAKTDEQAGQEETSEPAAVPRRAGGEGTDRGQGAGNAKQPQPSPGVTHRPPPKGGGEELGERHAPPIPFDADSIMPGKVPYASPVVRAFARELGVDLAGVRGSARGGRITREDVQQFVKGVMAGGAKPSAASGGGGLNLTPWPEIDFSKFGDIETQPLSRIKKLSGANLARNWAMIPHVTQFEDADVTDLEALRKALNKENERAGTKVTLLAFLIKASVACLVRYPEFNASLDASGEHLIRKKYFHIGFAADTPNGLVVPVIRDCDQKGVLAIAKEMAGLAKKAREGKLTPGEMSGGCFSISSLGGIGGTAFTPIINAPEVAILGVSRASLRPVWNGSEFEPRVILPLSLSYDHRVIDGAAAARFAVHLAQLLGDLRRALL